MFEETRKGLVKDYTFMLAAILTGVVFFLYMFFVATIYTQQKELVEVFAHEESEEWYTSLKYFSGGTTDRLAKTAAEGPPAAQIADGDTDAADLFYYAYDAAGNCIGQHKSSAGLAAHVEQIMAAKDIQNDEVQLQMFFQGNFRELSAYMITKKEIFDDGIKIGELYAGKDVLDYFIFLAKTFLFFMVFVLCIVIFSVYMAKRMADKAMVPIQQSFQRQKAFTADASHELRTPLSVLSAAVETIGRDKKNSLTEFSQRVLLDLQQEIQYMQKITEELLALAHLDNQQGLMTEPAMVIVNELLLQVRQIFVPITAGESISITVTAEGEPAVWADRDQLLQVLRILTDNAIKYTAAGGHVYLSVAKVAGNNVKICVTDDGCGIALEDRGKVFDRFFRVDKARSRQIGGTGLGLAIAQALVKVNGGTIHVESELGKGSAFVIEMPAYDKA